MTKPLDKSIAASPVGVEWRKNPHWQTQFYQCGMCIVNYTLITHLEKSEEETKWILDSLNLTGKDNSRDSIDFSHFSP